MEKIYVITDSQRLLSAPYKRIRTSPRQPHDRNTIPSSTNDGSLLPASTNVIAPTNINTTACLIECHLVLYVDGMS